METEKQSKPKKQPWNKGKAGLQQWIGRIQALGLTCFDVFVVTLSSWKYLIDYTGYSS